MESPSSDLIHLNESSLLEFATPNGAVPNRLLSPIEETSAETFAYHIQSTDERTISSNRADDSTLSLTTTNVELTAALVRKFSEHAESFRETKSHLDTLDTHLRELSTIVECFRETNNFSLILTTTIDQIETRLLQMRVKREQIRHTMNASPIRNVLERIPSSLLKSGSSDHVELISCIELSMNQTTNLIEHLRQERIHANYQRDERCAKIFRRQESLLKLTEKIEELIQQHRTDERSMFKNESNTNSAEQEHNRQLAEFADLNDQYRSLQDENCVLTSKAKTNLRALYLLTQSDHY